MKARARIDAINRLAARPYFWEQPSIINAFVACLSVKEACDALDVRDPVSWTLREAVLRKVFRDMASKGVQTCHLDLVKKLMRVYPDLPRERRSGCGYCLSYLYAQLPHGQQRAVVEFFMKSSHVAMRRRGIKILREQWDPSYSELVKDVWRSFPDRLGALLVIEQLDEAFVREQLNRLVELLKGAGSFAKVYLRVQDSAVTETLASWDEITYCYVRAKEKRPLREKDALAIFNRNKLDDRIGLAIWSFGQMGLWQVLEVITRKANAVGRLELEMVRKRYVDVGV